GGAVAARKSRNAYPHVLARRRGRGWLHDPCSIAAGTGIDVPHAAFPYGFSAGAACCSDPAGVASTIRVAAMCTPAQRRVDVTVKLPAMKMFTLLHRVLFAAATSALLLTAACTTPGAPDDDPEALLFEAADSTAVQEDTG